MHPFLDLAPQNAPLRDAILQAIGRVVDSQHYILGPEVENFEHELAAHAGVKQAIGVSSGSDALLITLMALGIDAGSSVLTTPFSFFSTVGAIVRLGARPVFCDIDADHYGLQLPAAQALGGDVQAAIPVHLFGYAPALPSLKAPLVEDAAQAIAAAPLRGIASCLSFFPSKNLGAAGDGGAVLTDDEGLADRLRLLRVHGSRPKYVHGQVGGNFRLDAVQAAVLRVKLPHLAAWIEARRSNAATYRRLFGGCCLPAGFSLPLDQPEHTYNQFVVRAPQRDGLRRHLAEYGIQTEVYYPLPLHLQPCFAHFGFRPGDFPQAERAATEVLALPIYPGLSPAQQEYVVEHIELFYRELEKKSDSG